MRLINVLRKIESLICLELLDCGLVVPLTQIIYPMFNRGKEMVKDVIAVIHDSIEKVSRHFFTNYIKRGLIWWKETLFNGPG